MLNSPPLKYSMCTLSHFSCIWLCMILWTVACQAALSMGFSRQQYWSGLPCPSLLKYSSNSLCSSDHDLAQLSEKKGGTSLSYQFSSRSKQMLGGPPMQAICCRLFQSANSSSVRVFCTYSIADKSPASSLTMLWLETKKHSQKTFPQTVSNHSLWSIPEKELIRKQASSSQRCPIPKGEWARQGEGVHCSYAPHLVQGSKHLFELLHLLPGHRLVVSIQILHVWEGRRTSVNWGNTSSLSNWAPLTASSPWAPLPLSLNTESRWASSETPVTQTHFTWGILMSLICTCLLDSWGFYSWNRNHPGDSLPLSSSVLDPVSNKATKREVKKRTALRREKRKFLSRIQIKPQPHKSYTRDPQDASPRKGFPPKTCFTWTRLRTSCRCCSSICCFSVTTAAVGWLAWPPCCQNREHVHMKAGNSGRRISLSGLHFLRDPSGLAWAAAAAAVRRGAVPRHPLLCRGCQCRPRKLSHFSSHP